MGSIDRSEIEDAQAGSTKGARIRAARPTIGRARVLMRNSSYG